MTLLEMVNKVLIRLREDTVSSVIDTPYSQLIVELINTTKREVEDAWNWAALSYTQTVTTSNGTPTYSVTGMIPRSKIIDVANDTTNTYLTYKPSAWFSKQYLTNSSTYQEPKFYTLNGLDSSENYQLDVFPIPDGVYSILVNFWKPQPDLVNDTDEILVPARIIIEGAVAKAISERGDDGGYTEQENRYLLTLGDYIAIEANMRPEEITWGAV
jgi:hypothetical protein